MDTSVWVRARTGRAPDLAHALAEMVRADSVLGHELVHLELLLGGGASRQRLLDDYRRLHFAPTAPADDVAAFVRDHRLGQRGIGAVDAHLLVSAANVDATLWTTDKNLEAVASALGLAHPV